MAASDDLLLDDDFLETSCLAREECVQELIACAPAGCFSCVWERVEDNED